jgi:hypothetical protein
MSMSFAPPLPSGGLYCRGRPAPQRAASNHILITTIAAIILPHLMKHLFTQERPDRRSVRIVRQFGLGESNE